MITKKNFREGGILCMCSSRWKKARRLEKWTVDQSKRLMVAAMFLGPSNWRKIAQSVPGQIDVNCRERWRNCIDPSLNFNKWTEEEDLRLKVAFQEYGNCWAKIAKCLAPRTNRQCLRRWKELFPDKVPLLQAARRIKKAAIISNFVDREVYRPALGPHDFVPLPVTGSLYEPENMKQSRKCKRKSRERAASGEDNTASPRNTSKRRGSKRRNVGAQISNEEAPGITNGTEAGYKYGKTKKGTKTRSRKNSLVQQAQDDLTLNFVSVPVTVTDDNDTGKNGESCKSQPRRAESILEEIDGNNQSCSMFHPESSELRMIDYDGIGTIDSNNLASSQKICSKSGDEEQFLITGFADIFMSSLDCPNSNLLEITNGHQDETVGQPDIQARSLH